MKKSKDAILEELDNVTIFEVLSSLPFALFLILFFDHCAVLASLCVQRHFVAMNLLCLYWTSLCVGLSSYICVHMHVCMYYIQDFGVIRMQLS